MVYFIYYIEKVIVLLSVVTLFSSISAFCSSSISQNLRDISLEKYLYIII